MDVIVFILYKILYLSAELGLTNVDYYRYLNYGEGHRVDDINDVHDFQATLKGNNLFTQAGIL